MEDVFPIEHGDIPLLYIGLPEGTSFWCSGNNHAGASVGNPRLVALHAASSCVEVGDLCMRNVSIGNL